MHRFRPSELIPETDLILYMASPCQTPEGIESRFAYCSDWAALLATATRHQTLTLLAMTAHHYDLLEAIPAPIACDRYARPQWPTTIARLRIPADSWYSSGSGASR